MNFAGHLVYPKSTVMDFITDSSGRHVLRLSTLLEAPDYVKNASILAEDVAALPNGAFAVPHKREFPVDAPGHVWLSYGYCKSASITDVALMQKLRTAGEFFGIAGDMDALDAAFGNLTKKASVERQFAIHIDFGAPAPDESNPMRKSGGVHGFYPIGTAFEVESSAIKLANEQARIPLELFAEGCRALVKAASETGVAITFLPKRILEYGVERIPSPEVLEQFASLRKAATNDDIYEQIAAAASANPEGMASHEWAELWLNADRQNGYKAARHEPDPFLLFNSGPTADEIDRQIESFVDIAGAPIPVTKVASVREDSVRKWFPKAAADKLIALIKQAATVTGSELTAAFADVEPAVANTFVKRLILA